MMIFKISRIAALVSPIFLVLGCGSEESDWIEVPLAKHTYYGAQSEYREEEFDILVLNQSAREFKLSLEEGAAITYEWSVEMENPEQLTAEFHGHTEREGEEPGTVSSTRFIMKEKSRAP